MQVRASGIHTTIKVRMVTRKGGLTLHRRWCLVNTISKIALNLMKHNMGWERKDQLCFRDTGVAEVRGQR